MVLNIRLRPETAGVILGVMEAARKSAINVKSQEALEILDRSLDEFAANLESSFIESLKEESKYVEEVVQLDLPFEAVDPRSVESGGGQADSNDRADRIESVRQNDPLD